MILVNILNSSEKRKIFVKNVSDKICSAFRKSPFDTLKKALRSHLGPNKFYLKHFSQKCVLSEIFNECPMSINEYPMSMNHPVYNFLEKKFSDLEKSK